MATFDSPGSTTGEITLLGTGGGYGESAVVHLGNNRWLIIDSCINPITRRALPLEYLQKIGVSMSDVCLIICTHWHDDHILGIAAVLEACVNSKFAFARANDLRKFLQFVQLDYSKLKTNQSNSSTVEFGRCMDILLARKVQPIWAGQDRVLYREQLGEGISSEVISLSPSDATIATFDAEVSSLITEFGPPNKKIVVRSPNAKSVVTFIKLGNHRALLGADLEVGSAADEGWNNILNACATIDQRASLFKIPHHGSENGYHPEVWKRLLVEDPVAKLTPWNLHDKLPQAAMLEVFKKHSKQVYMTSPIVGAGKPKKRRKNVEKLLRELGGRLHEVKFTEGTIRSRIAMDDKAAQWEVVAFPAAIQV
ncbi:MBL fold metallo-hydrolase [Asinibacterium sp. OR53]|uniref:MBL fold metallo-hydrolase n=1 Tax=Asinibacterium sp. OR53 TaxID=925409 RepID=UPI00047B158F|nr:MBL fold metallo-hydrolase [Asinibacterium sp. OR53]